MGPSECGQSSLCLFWHARAIFICSQAFHSTGRYLISSGHDQIINLVNTLAASWIIQFLSDTTQWTIPDLPTEPTSVPVQVHYPHFSTSAVHNGIVDWYVYVSYASPDELR